MERPNAWQKYNDDDKRKYLILQKNTDNLFRNVRLKENVLRKL